MEVVLKIVRLLTAVCVALPVMFSGVSDTVVCFGVDGHVALEMPHSQCCHEAECVDECEGTVFVQSVPDAAHCVDVPLSLDAMSHYFHKVVCPALLAGDVFMLSSIYFSAPGIGSMTGESLFLLRGCSLKTSYVLLVQKITVMRV
jgi:hypothetical protein